MVELTGDPWVDIGVPATILGAFVLSGTSKSVPARWSYLLFGVVFLAVYSSIPVVKFYCVGQPFKGYVCGDGNEVVSVLLSFLHRVSIYAYVFSLIPVFLLSFAYEVWILRKRK